MAMDGDALARAVMEGVPAPVAVRKGCGVVVGCWLLVAVRGRLEVTEAAWVRDGVEVRS